MTLSGSGRGGASHLLLDSATEVLLDELSAGGRLQLQITLQSLEWHIFMPTHAHAAARHPERVRCGFAIGIRERSTLEDPTVEAQMVCFGNLIPNSGMQGACALKDTTFGLFIYFCHSHKICNNFE